MILSAYNYDIEYRRSEENANADAMSRLPHEESTLGNSSTVYECTVMDDLPITAKLIAEATRKDPVLSKVLDFTMSGWQSQGLDESLKPYSQRQNELSSEQGCVLWGNKVVIPSLFQERLLEDLHWEHPGICAMKAIARSYVWWPNLDRDIECTVNACGPCQSTRNKPPAVPLVTWKWPERPWGRNHLEFFLKEKTFLIVPTLSGSMSVP